MRFHSSGFDKLAKPYRWLEYLTFGPLLMRTRLTFLPQISKAERALVLGDGDGRFCATLLRTNATVCVDAVDSSKAMLDALRSRAADQGAELRVTAHLQDVRAELPQGPFDLLCTHFLLDCLTDAEVRLLALAARRRIPNEYWVISEFAVPDGVVKWPATFLVWWLYSAFAMLTGLRVRELPEHGRILEESGFSCVAVRTRLFGILRSELWRADVASPSHAAR